MVFVPPRRRAAPPVRGSSHPCLSSLSRYLHFGSNCRSLELGLSYSLAVFRKTSKTLRSLLPELGVPSPSLGSTGISAFYALSFSGSWFARSSERTSPSLLNTVNKKIIVSLVTEPRSSSRRWCKSCARRPIKVVFAWFLVSVAAKHPYFCCKHVFVGFLYIAVLAFRVQKKDQACRQREAEHCCKGNWVVSSKLVSASQVLVVSGDARSAARVEAPSCSVRNR